MPDHRLERILEQIRFDPQNRYWKLIQELTRRALDVAQGDFVVGLSDLGGDLDILASLRGEERLAFHIRAKSEAEGRQFVGQFDRR